jgi:hypothetical protein
LAGEKQYRESLTVERAAQFIENSMPQLTVEDCRQLLESIGPVTFSPDAIASEERTTFVRFSRVRWPYLTLKHRAETGMVTEVRLYYSEFQSSPGEINTDGIMYSVNYKSIPITALVIISVLVGFFVAKETRFNVFGTVLAGVCFFILFIYAFGAIDNFLVYPWFL